MDINQLIQFILAISVSIAIIAISLQIAVLLGSITGLIKDFRKPVQDVGQVTGLAVEDYKAVRNMIYSFKNAFSFVKSATSLLERFSKRKGRKQNDSKTDQENLKDA